MREVDRLLRGPPRVSLAFFARRSPNGSTIWPFVFTKVKLWSPLHRTNRVVAIESDDHVQRPRRTAAWTRAVIGLTGIDLAIAQPQLLVHPALGVAGFVMIFLTACVHLCAPRVSWLKLEESLAGASAVLIIGLGNQQVTALSILWLAAVATGVMARGGRVHWIGRTVVLGALALPVIREGNLGAGQAALCVGAVGLLLTTGRLTRELNDLLWKARWDADHDDVTGLFSRAAFRVALEDASTGPEAG